MVGARPPGVRWARPAVVLGGAVLSLSCAGAATREPQRSDPRPDRFAVLRPADALGAVVATADDLWVDDRARQRLLRIDGRTGRVRAAIPVDGRLALSAAAGDVWALSRGRGYGQGLRGPLLRVDARTGRVRARIPLGPAVLGFGVQAVGRDAWVWGPHEILRVDGRARRVTPRIAVGDVYGELSGFVAAGGRLVAGTADGHILAFDRRTGRRLRTLSVGLDRPAPKAVTGGLVLYTASGVVGAVRLASGRVAWRRRLGFRAGLTVGSDGLVWVHSSALHEPGDRVTALRVRTGSTVTSGVLPVFGSTGIAAREGRVSMSTAGGAIVVFTPFAN